MKCENCNNEANFYYRTNINGKCSERHLCAECAHKQGLDRAFIRTPSRMFSHMGLGSRAMSRSGIGSLLDDFFSPSHSLLGAFDDFGLDSFFDDDFFFPRLIEGEAGEEETVCENNCACDAKPEQKNETINETKAESTATARNENEFSIRRRKEALKHQLHKAVREENFEKAIELRDQLKELEK